MRRKITEEVWKQVDTACAAGIGLREIARNMGIPEGTVLAHAKRKGLRKQIQTAKNAALSVQSIAITPMESAALTMQARAERHVARMAGVTDKVLPHLESMDPAEILGSARNLERFDYVARRNYGLDNQPPPGGTLSINVLTNHSLIQFEPRATALPEK